MHNCKIGQFVLHQRQLFAFISDWQLAREWLEWSFLHHYEDGPEAKVLTVCFAFRWLYPVQPVERSCDENGFLVHRENGYLPLRSWRGEVKVSTEGHLSVPFGAMVSEGRVSLRSFSIDSQVPPTTSMIVLRNAPSSKDPPDQSYGTNITSERIQFTAERSICLVQTTLRALLEDVWYKNWNILLDEIDDRLRISVSDPIPASCF